VVIEAALAGDQRLARLILEWSYGGQKCRALIPDLPEGDTPQDDAACFNAILGAAKRGEVTLDEAERMIRLIEARRRFCPPDMAPEPAPEAVAEPQASEE